ncbi:MAG TPA: ribosome-associated translation inhibitor RaiA [Terriglobia bacterium]|nr:ribosome-associated translation inhibitor RaiA [Terriglobia bacterium]
MMNLEIRSQGFNMSEALERYAERRLGFALRKFAKEIGRVTVRLSDLNGPRGGADKRCQITASLPPSPAVTLQAVEADPYAAIDRAAARLERALARSMGRTRESRRRRMSIRKPEGIRLRPLGSRP